MKEETSIDNNDIDTELLTTIINNIFLTKTENKAAINLIGRENLKEVINYLIKDIVITDRNIMSITFKNGLNIGFSY